MSSVASTSISNSLRTTKRSTNDTAAVKDGKMQRLASWVLKLQYRVSLGSQRFADSQQRVRRSSLTQEELLGVLPRRELLRGNALRFHSYPSGVHYNDRIA
jgi:hypothetical protein